MFVACGIWCLADVSSVSPSSEQILDYILFVCLSVCLFVCLCLFVRVCFCLFVCLSVCLPVSVFVCLLFVFVRGFFVYLFVCLAYLSVGLSGFSVCLGVLFCLAVWLDALIWLTAWISSSAKMVKYIQSSAISFRNKNPMWSKGSALPRNVCLLKTTPKRGRRCLPRAVRTRKIDTKNGKVNVKIARRCRCF